MKKVGKYSAGLKNFHLYVEEKEIARGAQFWIDDGKARCRINVDINAPWERVYTWLLHEVTEMVYAMTGNRHAQAPSMSQDNGQYIFVLTHTEFSECTAWVAEAMETCTDDLRKAWEKYSNFYKGDK